MNEMQMVCAGCGEVVESVDMDWDAGTVCHWPCGCDEEARILFRERVE